jgi:hypothetical protein
MQDRMLAIFFFICLTIGASISSEASAQSSCDPSIHAVLQHRLGYRQRGDRCEGIYWEPHAGREDLCLVSFVREGSKVPSNTPSSLCVAWASGAAVNAPGDIHIRATALRNDLFYRMDSIRKYQEGTYVWPMDVIRDLSLSVAELGITAAIKSTISGVSWTVYEPLTIAEDGQTSSSFLVTLISAVPIQGITWDCRRIDADGMPGTRVAGERLRGSFPASQPIRLRLSVPGFSGLCYMDIRTESSGFGSGSPISTSFVVRVPR